MKTDLFWIVLSLVIASLVTAALVVGEITLGTVLFVTAGLVVTVRVAPRIAIENDRKWITTLLPLAFVAKMGGSIARYLMVTEVYGSGDSFGYYNRAIQLVHTWRSYDLPETTFGGSGTRFVDLFTSFLFVPSVPTFLFAFLLFATLSFIGLIFFYLAFRRWFRDDPKLLLLYAGFVFFMPSLLFWPSSIGKDAIMVFALGIAAYGGARVLEGSYLKGAAGRYSGVTARRGYSPPCRHARCREPCLRFAPQRSADRERRLVHTTDSAGDRGRGLEFRRPHGRREPER